MMPLLSILIPTVEGREQQFGEISRNIHSQIRLINKEHSFPLVNILYAIDDKTMTIGEKREWLYHEASGKYSWQIDDDDDIPSDAISIILLSALEGADCITFKEHCSINGGFYTSNHSLKYDDWGENQDGFDYVRTPFMKSVIKTEIARSVPIPHIRFGEDHKWAIALKPHLKNEIHIDQELYYYQHNSKPEDFNSRYGITQ